MSALKTLKDFEEECVSCETPLMCEGQAELIKELREVAKEWVTHLWGEVGLVATKAKREKVIPVNEMIKLNAQIDWINMFFNLEDENK